MTAAPPTSSVIALNKMFLVSYRRSLSCVSFSLNVLGGVTCVSGMASASLNKKPTTNAFKLSVVGFDNPNRQYNQVVSDFDANNSFMPNM